MIYMKMGDPDRALRIAEEVRRSPSWSGDSLTERLLLSITAVHAIHQGNYLQAKSQYTRLLETAPRGGIHELDYATDLGTMGTIHWHLREYDRAGEMYRRAIGIYRETRDTTWGQFANLKGNLGLVYLRTGSFREAAAWAASAVASYAALHREDHPDCLTHRINRTFGLEGAGEITEAIGESLVNNEALRNLFEKTSSTGRKTKWKLSFRGMPHVFLIITMPFGSETGSKSLPWPAACMTTSSFSRVFCCNRPSGCSKRWRQAPTRR